MRMLLAGLLFLTWLGPAPVTSHAITIEDFSLVASGQMQVQPASQTFNVQIFGSQFDFSGAGGDFRFAGSPPGVTPVFDLNGPISLSAAASTSTDQSFHYQGAPHPGFGSFDLFAQAAAPVSGLPLGFRIDTPFLMTGKIFGEPFGPNRDDIRLSVLGGGTATGIFDALRDPQGHATGQYKLDFLTYNFTVVPEPATSAMLVTGLAGIALWRWRSLSR